MHECRLAFLEGLPLFAILKHWFLVSFKYSIAFCVMFQIFSHRGHIRVSNRTIVNNFIASAIVQYTKQKENTNVFWWNFLLTVYIYINLDKYYKTCYICDTEWLHASTAFRSLVWTVRSVEEKLVMKLSEHTVIRYCFLEFTLQQNYALGGTYTEVIGFKPMVSCIFNFTFPETNCFKPFLRCSCRLNVTETHHKDAGEVILMRKEWWSFLFWTDTWNVSLSPVSINFS